MTINLTGLTWHNAKYIIQSYHNVLNLPNTLYLEGLSWENARGIVEFAYNNASTTITLNLAGLNWYNSAPILEFAYNTLFQESSDSAPTNIVLSSSNILDNNTIGDVVGELSAVDSDEGDTFTYSLVAGTGSTDNDSFTIDGVNLKAAEVFDYATKNEYSVRIRVTDSYDNTFEKVFTISIGFNPETNTLDISGLGLPSSNIDDYLIYNANLILAVDESLREQYVIDNYSEGIDVRGNDNPTAASSNARQTLFNNYVLVNYNTGYTP